MNEIEFPYLDRKISSDSLEYAKENIWYHLLPYIVAQTDNELQGYKSIISLSLQSSILDELKTQQDKIQYKINALKNRKLNKYLFDLYLYEHQFYEANGGDDTVLMGYTLRDIETILRKDASILILIYFRILNLLRLAKYAPKKYSINRSSKMVYNLHTASDTNEITRCFWSYDKIEKSWQKYKSVGHIIYGYVQTLVDHNILDLNLNFTTSTNISTIISDYNEYDSFIDSILGYAIYAQEILTNLKSKNSETTLSVMIIPPKILKKFKIKNIQPKLQSFSTFEENLYGLTRQVATNIVRK